MSTFCKTLCALAGIAALATQVCAQDINYASYGDLVNRVEELQATVDALQVSQQKTSTSTCQKCDPCATSDPCWCKPCTPGMFAKIELLMLAWHDTDGDDDQSHVYSGSRYTMGYMTGCGRAFQVRYFEFNSHETPTSQLFIEHLDFEYAGRFTLGCNWNGQITLGGRWASLGTPQRDWNGTLGPVIGVGLRSDIRTWLALYGNFRQSIQFGIEGVENNLKPFAISEIALGVELSKRMRNTTGFFRLGFEAQQYECVRDDEEDYGLYGYTLAVGVRR